MARHSLTPSPDDIKFTFNSAGAAERLCFAKSNEVQELKKELYQVKQDSKEMREEMFSVLNES